KIRVVHITFIFSTWQYFDSVTLILTAVSLTKMTRSLKGVFFMIILRLLLSRINAKNQIP
ncbi:MAG: hypothetical protein KDD04_10190, partial [Sinomicrobium sp.]|nr:hypothetical protein [Sinomicrobium sp.]